MKGLDARFTWLGGRKAAAVELILEELLPLARTGLKAEGIAAEDVDRYLGTLEERVRAERTGAAWLLASLGAVKQRGTRWEQVNALVAATLDRQRSGEPVHTWRPAELDEAGGWARNYLTVGQLMNTDLFTVNPEESLDLVANLMVWHRIRHVMVEDEEHRLLGLVSHRHLLRLVGRELPKQEGQTAPVASVMVEDPITVQPDTPTVQAIRTLREERISCLPVVSGEGRLVGVVTEDDFMTMAGSLLEEKLGES
jgi:CBS domain-containing protein